MTYLTLLLFLVFRIQSIWANLPVQQNEFSIDKVRVYAEFIMPYCVSNGFCTEDESITIEMRDVKPWLPQHSQIVQAGMDPREVFEVMMGFQSPPPYWRAGTDPCAKLIVFNPQWERQNYVFYGSPSWRETVTHETAHIAQGCVGYVDTTQKEWTAKIMGMEMLASADVDKYPDTYAALVESIQEMIIGATIEHLAFADQDVQGFVDGLNLTDGWRIFFSTWATWCENSPAFCKMHSDRYWRGPLFRILSGYEIIPLAANQQGEIVIDDLAPLLFQWFSVDCVRPHCVE